MHQETSNELDQCTWYQGSQTDFFNIRSLQTRPIIFLFFFILALDLKSLECQVVRFVTHLGVL